ncbi:hypothetical protein V3C99_016451 [Haemonchus contortus]|uniref:Transmembrane protein n=1 Tax=Haemonchus contortus TaxID=6289 RepID=A0A7I4Z0A8_HAECO
MSGRFLEVHLLAIALPGWLAVAVLLTPLVLFTCNRKSNDKTWPERQKASGDSERSSREVVDGDIEMARAELKISDSVRDVRPSAKPGSNQQGKFESASSTELIVVPLGKAKTAKVTRNSLTRPSDRKRDLSQPRSSRPRVVRFRDEKSSTQGYREEPTDAESET